ncbi:MAG: hypothetical protein LBP34_05905 [Flavobacteriaceae bacterium]|jgi:hypothetical protein|nr:hypothetical protein [Flavobacteriaceae bacterium]
MSKKLTFCIVCLFCLSFSLSAQEKTKPFSHLGVGLGVSTAGITLDVASPLNDYFVLRTGISAFPYTYSNKFDVGYDFKEIDDFINANPTVKAELTARGLPTTTANFDKSVDMDAKLGLFNGKILIDFYPFKNSGFFLSAGAYIGKDKLVSVKGSLPEESSKIVDILNQHSDEFKNSIVIGDYTIDAVEGAVDASIKINKVKPYVGLGYGRTVSKKRTIGFQFELGTMFHGTPKIASSNSEVQKTLNKELESEGFIKIMEKIIIYPVISFKITGKIF